MFCTCASPRQEWGVNIETSDGNMNNYYEFNLYSHYYNLLEFLFIYILAINVDNIL